MGNLRQSLIKLGVAKPELRPHIRPLLAKTGGLESPGAKKDLEKEISALKGRIDEISSELDRGLYPSDAEGTVYRILSMKKDQLVLLEKQLKELGKLS